MADFNINDFEILKRNVLVKFYAEVLDVDR